MFAIAPDGKRLVGHLAKRQAITNARNTVYASKRLIGRRFDSPEMKRAIEGLASLRARYDKISVTGNREFNPGWHTAMDLGCLLTVSEAVTRSALTRKESRGGHFRLDYEAKDEAQGKVNTVIRKAPNGTMEVVQEPVPQLTEEQEAIIEEMK